MTVVLVSVQLGYKSQNWFDDNPTFLLKQGERVDLDQTGLYKNGDGTTQLSDLEFLGYTEYKNMTLTPLLITSGEPVGEQSLAGLDAAFDVWFNANPDKTIVKIFTVTGGDGITGYKIFYF